MSAGTPRLSDLLQHREFLERFARSLARDHAVAEDVVQETWLTALERPPKHHGDLRAWLRRVARNAFLQRSRSRARATSLEASSIERTESPVDSNERENTGRLLASELLALPELYRGVLILRFYEDKTPTEIARELDRPLNTVTSQIARGLKLMQERLDRSHPEGRSRWLPTVLVLARGREREASASDGGAPIARSIGGLRATVAFFAAAAVVVAVVLVLRAPERARVMEPAGMLVAREESTLVAPATPDGRAPEPIDPTAATVPDAPLAAAAAPVASVVVEVVGPNGPIEGAMVHPGRVEPPQGASEAMMRFKDPHATDRDGRVEIQVGEQQRAPFGATGADSLLVLVEAEGFVVSDVQSVPFPESGTVSMTFSLAPASTIVRGRVTDEAGAPIEGALVSVGTAVDRHTDLGAGRSSLRRDKFRETRADGTYQHDGVPPGSLRVRVEHSGFVPEDARTSVADGAVTEHDAVLRRGATVAGRVTTADGSRAAGASMRAVFSVGGELTAQEAVADEDGAFEVRGLAPGRTWIFARHADQPGLSAAVELQLAYGETRVWNPVLEERPPLRLRVQREDGSPWASALVVLNAANEGDGWQQFLTTDASGRVSVELVPANEMTALVYLRPEDLDHGLPPCYGEQGLHAAVEEHLLTVPAARLERGRMRGVVLDHDGHPAVDAILQIRGGLGAFFYWTPADATGAFDLDGLPTQLYDVVVLRAGAGTFSLGGIEVLPRDLFDFGEILLPSPTTWTPLWPIPDAPTADAYELVKIDRFDDFEKRWTLASGATPPPASFELLPGKYEWLVYRAAELTRREAFEVH